MYRGHYELSHWQVCSLAGSTFFSLISIIHIACVCVSVCIYPALKPVHFISAHSLFSPSAITLITLAEHSLSVSIIIINWFCYCNGKKCIYSNLKETTSLALYMWTYWVHLIALSIIHTCPLVFITNKIISLHPLIKAVYTDRLFHMRAEAEELCKSKSSIHLHSESIGLPRSTNFSISFFFFSGAVIFTMETLSWTLKFPTA